MNRNRSRDKGNRVEKAISDTLNSVPGVVAQRVPLSGSAGGAFGGDLQIEVSDFNLRAEVKARKGGHGWALLKRWLGDNQLLFLKEDHEAPLVVMPMSLLERFLGRIGEDAIDGDEADFEWEPDGFSYDSEE